MGIKSLHMYEASGLPCDCDDKSAGGARHCYQCRNLKPISDEEFEGEPDSAHGHYYRRFIYSYKGVREEIEVYRCLMLDATENC